MRLNTLIALLVLPLAAFGVTVWSQVFAEEPAQPASVCPSGITTQEMLGNAKANGFRPINLSASVKDTFLSNFNAVPPVSDVTAARVDLVPVPQGGFTVVLFSDVVSGTECLTDVTQVPDEVLAELLQEAPTF